MRVIDQGRHARRALDAYDRDVHTTEEFCHDRDLSIATDLDSDKKKKDLRDLGRHKYIVLNDSRFIWNNIII